MTPVEQVKREAVRLEAAKSFEAGAATAQIAVELRVTERSVRRWRAAWRQGGVAALASAGPMAVEKLSPRQWQRLEAELKRGPLAHGFDDEEQGWTLKRVKLLIGRLFHVGYTVQGVWRLLKHGWSCQVPVRRALERDEAAIEVWKTELWPRVKVPRTTGAPTSALRTKAASR
ncbi:winged helix-turn-helix domain-containing protein [Streptomyces sp. NPDC058642]|uniref:winged helix-turn-helix domain-containing protein n=1 Tax=Streptomyces sp. NPDC058642 TaxID=3346572 RepID=UPI0036637D76